MARESFWQQVSETEDVMQGDFLPDCAVPLVSLPEDVEDAVSPLNVRVEIMDLIVVTQSCDLENGKTATVALCSIHTFESFSSANPRKKDFWENVRRGRVEGFHLLSSFEEPDDNQASLIVDLREIFCLPFEYVARHAVKISPRWRLKSPYLEHFSQAFGRCYSRVALPSDIPQFK